MVLILVRADHPGCQHPGPCHRRPLPQAAAPVTESVASAVPDPRRYRVLAQFGCPRRSLCGHATPNANKTAANTRLLGNHHPARHSQPGSCAVALPDTALVPLYRVRGHAAPQGCVGNLVCH